MSNKEIWWNGDGTQPPQGQMCYGSVWSKKGWMPWQPVECVFIGTNNILYKVFNEDRTNSAEKHCKGGDIRLLHALPDDGTEYYLSFDSNGDTLHWVGAGDRITHDLLDARLFTKGEYQAYIEKQGEGAWTAYPKARVDAISKVTASKALLGGLNE